MATQDCSIPGCHNSVPHKFFSLGHCDPCKKEIAIVTRGMMYCFGWIAIVGVAVKAVQFVW